MSAFSSRSGGYKLGLITLYIFTALYIGGFAAPYWASFTLTASTQSGSDVPVTASVGLWVLCSSGGGDSACVTLGGAEVLSWLTFVRVTESMGLAMLLVGSLYGLAVNCCRQDPPPYSRCLEEWAASGGFVGLIGTVVFFVMNKDVITFSWAVYMEATASSGALLSSFIIGVANPKPDEVAPTSSSTTATTTGEAIAMQNLGGEPRSSPGQRGVTPSAPFDYHAVQSYSPSAPVYHVPTAPPSQPGGGGYYHYYSPSPHAQSFPAGYSQEFR